MRKRLVWIGILVVLAAVALRFTLLRPEPIPVRVARVEPARVESTITNSKAGTVRARRRAKLSAEMGGRVVALTYREGDAVEEGALLVQLSDATPRAQLLLAQLSLRVAESGANEACIARNRALRDVRRKRSLAEQNIVSEDLLDALQSTFEAADATCNARKAQVGRAEAEITAMETELAKYSIYAPFAGVIAEQDVEVGEWIMPSPPLLTVPAVIDLIDPTSVYVSAPMDEVDSAKIRAGQAVKVTVDSHPGQDFPARVVRLSPYVLDVVAQNRTLEIEVDLDDAKFASTLLPGTSADVEVVLDVREGVLRIPTSALLEGDRVLVASDGRLEERAVEVGLKNWDYVEVRGGLEEGQLVVSSLDRAEVQAGARVAIENATPNP
ncbi:MAG: efflux RND transporter periplasmic adaptor subunit [Myxococcales bacterium]|nr:efflux RND transporter periplasmic adaptor subunit [Myxococcales bacterium]